VLPRLLDLLLSSWAAAPGSWCSLMEAFGVMR
jgi:hypothetical protein